jgi:hypothetical protein
MPTCPAPDVRCEESCISPSRTFLCQSATSALTALTARIATAGAVSGKAGRAGRQGRQGGHRRCPAVDAAAKETPDWIR